MAQENERKTSATETGPLEETATDETDVPSRPGWRDIFCQAFDKARREQRPTNRRELGRDRSRSLFLLAGAAIAVLLLFLGVFSSSNTARKSTVGRRPGTPDLGRKVTPGQHATGQTGSVTPLLNAEAEQPQASGGQDVTPEEVGRTARPTQSLLAAQPKPATTSSVPRNAGPYALGNIDFSDVVPNERGPRVAGSSAHSASDDLRKPSLVFVRSVQSNGASSSTKPGLAAVEQTPIRLNLSAGTRVVARLQSVGSSAIKTPLFAASE